MTPKHVVMDVEGHACHEHDVLVTGAGQQTRPKKKSWEEKNKTELERDNGVIILDLKGLISDPSIRNLEYPISLFKSHHD